MHARKLECELRIRLDLRHEDFNFKKGNKLGKHYFSTWLKAVTVAVKIKEILKLQVEDNEPGNVFWERERIYESSNPLTECELGSARSRCAPKAAIPRVRRAAQNRLKPPSHCSIKLKSQAPLVKFFKRSPLHLWERGLRRVSVCVHNIYKCI